MFIGAHILDIVGERVQYAKCDGGIRLTEEYTIAGIAGRNTNRPTAIRPVAAANPIHGGAPNPAGM